MGALEKQHTSAGCPELMAVCEIVQSVFHLIDSKHQIAHKCPRPRYIFTRELQGRELLAFEPSSFGCQSRHRITVNARCSILARDGSESLVRHGLILLVQSLDSQRAGRVHIFHDEAVVSETRVLHGGAAEVELVQLPGPDARARVFLGHGRSLRRVVPSSIVPIASDDPIYRHQAHNARVGRASVAVEVVPL